MAALWLLVTLPDDQGRPVRYCTCQCHNTGQGDRAQSAQSGAAAVTAAARPETKLSDPIAAVFACAICVSLHAEGKQ